MTRIKLAAVSVSIRGHFGLGCGRRPRQGVHELLAIFGDICSLPVWGSKNKNRTFSEATISVPPRLKTTSRHSNGSSSGDSFFVCVSKISILPDFSAAMYRPSLETAIRSWGYSAAGDETTSVQFEVSQATIVPNIEPANIVPSPENSTR